MDLENEDENRQWYVGVYIQWKYHESLSNDDDDDDDIEEKKEDENETNPFLILSSFKLSQESATKYQYYQGL